jgi:toxin ParE1/3/4
VNIEWSSRAERDRSQQIDFIALDNPRAGIEVGDRVVAAVSHLLLSPMLGRARRIAGSRELVIGRSPYIVVYIVQRESLRILCLPHGAMQEAA